MKKEEEEEVNNFKGFDDKSRKQASLKITRERL